MSKRLMCVVAHPDDECFGFAGALILASRAGFETYVVCLTQGEAATNRGNLPSPISLGEQRREEFARSCAKLDVTEHEILQYPDGELEAVTVSSGARELVRRMRAWKPQIVLTFGLDGSLNVHPDHTMTSCFASAAFHWSARSKRFPELDLATWAPQRLYHQSTAFTVAEREPQFPAPWTTVIDISMVKAQKQAAFHEHASQLPVLEKIQPYWDLYGDTEHYTLAAANTPQPSHIATSLFDGVS